MLTQMTTKMVTNILFSLAEAKGTAKPVFNGHSIIDKPKILMTNGSLLKVKGVAECSS